MDEMKLKLNEGQWGQNILLYGTVGILAFILKEMKILNRVVT